MKPRPLHSDESSQQFLSLAEEYATQLAHAGAKARVTREPGICAIFDSLDAATKQAVLGRIRGDLEVFQEIREEGYQLKDSPRLLWRYLVRCGLTPSADIFDRIEDGDVVIVYDVHQLHVFQNLKFFDFVSVTLEQLFCTPWYRYVKREEWVEKAIYDAGVSLATGKLRNTFDPEVPEHLVWEVDTELLLKFKLKLRWMSPLFVNNQVAGAIIVNRCTQLE